MGPTALLATLTLLSAPSWGVEQATGGPNAPLGQDSGRAWTTERADGGPEWLTVTFATPVDVERVRIRESFNAGAIIAVTAVLDDNESVVLWSGQRGAMKPGWFEVSSKDQIRAKVIRIDLDTSIVRGWNEIDAVQLIGSGRRQWAKHAAASSSYGKPVPAAQRNILSEIKGKWVTLMLADGNETDGRVTDIYADFVRLERDDGVTLVKKDAIQMVDWANDD